MIPLWVQGMKYSLEKQAKVMSTNFELNFLLAQVDCGKLVLCIPEMFTCMTSLIVTGT